VRGFEAHSYGCLMLRLPTTLTEMVRAYAASIPNDRIQSSEGESGFDGTPHVTVKYGLHTDDPDEVRAKLSGWGPVFFSLGSPSVFHNEGSAVLKIRVQSPDIMRLNKFVCNNFKTTDTHPTYQPHVTIAYLKHDKMDPYWYTKYYTDIFDGLTATVHEVEFSPAEGEKVMIPLTDQTDLMVARVTERVAKSVIAGDEWVDDGTIAFVKELAKVMGRNRSVRVTEVNRNVIKFDFTFGPATASLEMEVKEFGYPPHSESVNGDISAPGNARFRVPGGYTRDRDPVEMWKRGLQNLTEILEMALGRA